MDSRAAELQYLDHSELALARLYNDISEAQETIDLTYLIWDPCSTASKVLMKKIREKALPSTSSSGSAIKPVKVRMLIDSYFHRRELGALAAYFRENGVEIKFFNPTIDPTGGNVHSHSKMALIDKKIPGRARLITGGRNIADEYFGMGMKNYVDRDVAVFGPSSSQDKKGVIAQADHGFDRLWASDYSREVSAASEDRMRRIRDCTRWTQREADLEKHLQTRSKGILESQEVVSCSNVKFTIDDMSHTNVPGKPINSESGMLMPATVQERLALKPTSRAVLDLIRGSQETLALENLYYIPDDSFMKGLLRKKRGSGVKINLYSNMFEGSSSKNSIFDDDFEIVSHWQSHYLRKENVGTQTNHAKFRIPGLMDRWHFTPKEASYTYHAKTFVADGKDAIVSSFNIDPRSMHINGESALVVKGCSAFAGRVEETARLTGKIWAAEEEHAVCMGQGRPHPASTDHFSRFIQFISKELQ